jgi:hypothetical protein
MSPRERPIPEDDFIAGMGLVVTTAVGCLMLVPLVFQSSNFGRAVGVAIAGLVVGTIIAEIRRRRGSVRGTSQLLPQVHPTELTWNEWPVGVSPVAGGGNRATDTGRRWSTAVAQSFSPSLPWSPPAWASSYSSPPRRPAIGQPRGTSLTRSPRRTILVPAWASEPSSYSAGPAAADQRGVLLRQHRGQAAA